MIDNKTRELLNAALPFTQRSTSDETLTLTFDTKAIERLRRATSAVAAEQNAPLPRRTHTRTYSTLEVSRESYADITQRIREAFKFDPPSADHYFEDELIVLGDVALAIDTTEPDHAAELGLPQMKEGKIALMVSYSLPQGIAQAGWKSKDKVYLCSSLIDFQRTLGRLRQGLTSMSDGRNMDADGDIISFRTFGEASDTLVQV